jgi:hypothetical protein
MIQAQPRVTPPGVAEVIPERVDLFFWMQDAQRIGPTLFGQRAERVEHFRPKQSLPPPTFRLVDIEVSRVSPCVTVLAKVTNGVLMTIVPPAPALAEPILTTVFDPDAPPVPMLTVLVEPFVVAPVQSP